MEQGGGSGRIEVADVGAEERHQRRLRRAVSHPQEAVLVGRQVCGHAEIRAADGTNRLHRLRQRRAG
jgi:hypothetical protein